MTIFDECPRGCGSTSTEMTTLSLYECENEDCGEIFCGNCREDADGRCPACGSEDHKKIGVVDYH